MQQRLTLFIIASLMFATFSFATKANDVVIEPDQVHVPLGFDSNDKNIQFVVTGVVSDTCTQRPRGVVKIDGNKISVEMRATKITGTDMMCIQALVPYLATVTIGHLPEGYYDIKVNEGTIAEKDDTLFVARPSSKSIDNFTYANVTKVVTEPESNTIILKGAHPSSCMNIERIEIVPNTNGNTIAILPIVQQAQPICDRMMKPFEYELSLPSTISHESVVFHIRTIAGNAFNVGW